ncbi:MAG TPA: N,N-dimethylformamidase beta subunit family domain-containing protein, partial [Ktedonobacteraceae bacterium]|nr:N,N-dimethylformamidase beta subunit family domain-containing protein [Ktedonobacteraceae bacterium]
FYVSTQTEGTSYTLAIYRLGWYQGTGGRLMSSVQLTGKAQGYYVGSTFELVNCPTAFQDPSTGLVEARWQPSYMLTIPHDWTTGVYLVKCIDEYGKQTYTTFDVLGNETAPYIVVTADTTYAAYNNWGGRSLYPLSSKGKSPAAKVSFDRPSTMQDGSDQVLIFEANTIRWLEREGYNVSYMSSIDLHTHPEKLLNHQAYLSIGHDEYWTKEMRDGVEAARDHGVGLAFLEANASYWQIRLEPNSAGVPNRTVVCYKVLSTDNLASDSGGVVRNSLAQDPLFGVDNTRVTSLWRDPVIGRPENAMVGIMYSDYNSKLRGTSWTFDPQITGATFLHNTLLQGTGLQAGQSFDNGLVGYEWDRVFNNGHTPAGLQILATSEAKNIYGIQDTSNTAYYIAPSGALVFATGSIYWTAALDSYRYDWSLNDTSESQEIPEIQQLMTNIMNALIKQHR